MMKLQKHSNYNHKTNRRARQRSRLIGNANTSPQGRGIHIMKYSNYSDPSHGWLKVSVEEINQLGITQDITAYSYISADGKYAFLEEDQDAELFINAALNADWFENFEAIRRCTKEFYSDFPSFIRNLESFSTYKENDYLKFCLSKSFEL